uniref:Uncharacterized protein n=1 Tax=Coccidioides posadasii RMSCC 3488 TaxID=454284 RepID=A0A0J6F0P9_COCPO|nr:hypothetical protein CPAG_02795 [Coccidioides posadasii RMSCC 3488]
MTIDGLKKEATITSGAQARDTRALNFPLILHSMQPLTFLLPTVVTFILGQVRVVQASCDPSNQYTALTFTSKAFFTPQAHFPIPHDGPWVALSTNAGAGEYSSKIKGNLSDLGSVRRED